MSTFAAWWRSWQKTQTVKQFTYVCGVERVLVEDVVRSMLSVLKPDPWNLTNLVAGADSERTIWAEADQYPLGASRRVVVIRNAERLQNWDALARVIEQRASNPKTYFILVSDEERAPKVRDEEANKTVFAPHLSSVAKRGQIIECISFTQSTSKTAVEWVQAQIKVREGIAGHLLDRADGNLRLVRDTVRKVRALGQTPSLSTINSMLSERPRDSFADALLALDKKTALMALERMDSREYSRTIGFLDSRLDLAGLVHDMQATGKNMGEMMRAAGNKNFLVPDIVPVAKHYNYKRRLKIRNLLVLADEAVQGGTTEGVFETVVSLW
jgi:DNA polymerase III delta subunit